MANKRKDPMSYPDAQRAYAEAALIGEAAETIRFLLEQSGMKQRDLAEKLGVTEGRISQMLSRPGNLTLRSLAALGWAIGGVRFELTPVGIKSRLVNTPTEVIDQRPLNLIDWPFKALRILPEPAPTPGDLSGAPMRVKDGELKKAG